MKDAQSYKGRRIDLFPRFQDDGTWSCFVKIDDAEMSKEAESGVTKEFSKRCATRAEARTKALKDSKRLVDVWSALQAISQNK